MRNSPNLLNLLSVAVLLLFAGPASGGYDTVVVKDVPHVKQKPDFCGEACVAMVLGKLGHGGDQDWVFNMSGLDPIEGRGCYTPELVRAVKAIGFQPGPVWHRIRANEANTELEALWEAVHADLKKGIPSILCMRYDEEPETTEHFRLVLGYDAETDEVIYHEPAVRDGGYRRMSRTKLFSLWPLKYKRDIWTVVRLRLQAASLRKPSFDGRHSRADFAQHIRALRKEPGIPDGFTVIIQPPFVVIGDESPEMVRRRATGTVKWAVDMLKQDYFERDPEEILDVWLFRNKASYEKHTWALFRDRPGTPYGYYSPAHGLVMNIGTGGGTLVHEIVHPFMEANFPDCPAWFNEGMGSLYEQSGTREGHIRGLTNWRLSGLQKAIRARRVPTFKRLTHTTTHEFYEADPGTHYAQARYLLYYLQEKGLLVRYYHAFVKNQKKDPTGYATLRRILGRKGRDMAAFQKEWEAYVLKLRFGR